MSTKCLLVLTSLCLIGCATVPKETPAGKAVNIVQKDVPTGCKELGFVEWEGEGWHNLSDAKFVLKEKTAELGGNVLRLESLAMSPAATGAGTAFLCPKN